MSSPTGLAWQLAGGLIAVAVVSASAAFGQSTAASGPTQVATANSTAGGMQSLVREADFQIRLTFRHNLPEHARRRAQLEAAIAQWRTAPRNDENNRLLSDWLRHVIRASMPGSGEDLPPLPEYKRPTVVERAQSEAPASKSATVRQKPVASDVTDRTSTGSGERSMVQGSTPQADGNNSARQAPADSANFWSGHPANAELPAELTTGNPFRDDP